MTTLLHLLLVATGGALGAIARYLFSLLPTSTLPLPTLGVNLLGSLLIGLVLGYVAKGQLSAEAKLLLITGFCGSFTTFSTFAHESLLLLKGGDFLMALLYLVLSIALGITAVWIGLRWSL